jgi:hypothetical protein
VTRAETPVEDPNQLALHVINVAGDAIASAQAVIRVSAGTTVLDQFAAAPAPRTVALKSGFVQITITVTAPFYFDESATLLYGVYGAGQWSSTNVSWKVTRSGGVVSVDVVCGRVRYAPVTADTQKLPPDYIAPGIVLDSRPNSVCTGRMPR